MIIKDSLCTDKKRDNYIDECVAFEESNWSVLYFLDFFFVVSFFLIIWFLCAKFALFYSSARDRGWKL